MTTSLSIWQRLNTPITFRSKPDVKRLREAKKLYRNYQHQKESLLRKKQHIQRHVEAAISRNDAAAIQVYAQHLCDLARKLMYLEELAPSATGAQASITFVVPSYMLVESYRICCETEAEGMHFVLGFVHEDEIIATEIATFPYSHRSAAGAGGVHAATHDICISAYERGQRVAIHIHSHPGSGIHANHYSATDERTQALWEPAYGNIGAIWSRDGYLRFYSLNLPYQVKIIGNHIHEVEPNVWKLEEDAMEMPNA